MFKAGANQILREARTSLVLSVAGKFQLYSGMVSVEGWDMFMAL